MYESTEIPRSEDKKKIRYTGEYYAHRISEIHQYQRIEYGAFQKMILSISTAALGSLFVFLSYILKYESPFYAVEIITVLLICASFVLAISLILISYFNN